MLKDKVIIITGAAGRIGASLAGRVIAEGGSVALIDVDTLRLKTLTSELPSERVLSITCDTSAPEDVDRCIAAVSDRFGVINAAIHSAYPRSKGWGTAFEDLKPEFLFEDLSIHLGGSILFSQCIMRHFMKQGFGNLIHISSIQGVSAPKFEHYNGTDMVSPIEYSAMKSAIIAMTRYLAKYYKGNNIRVNCVSPGGILDNQPESFQFQYRQSCNSKGMLDAEDVIGTLLFLISDNSQCITGQNIIVDDGWSL